MVRKALSQLIFGKGLPRNTGLHPTLRKRRDNLVAIWNNAYQEDAGLEKAVRLFLAAVQFLFPGTYIRHLFWRKGPLMQDFAIEVFVLAKTFLPLVGIYFGWTHQPWIVALVVWFMLETVTYIPTLIFASDTFPTPRSFRRSKILIFLNYLEVVFALAAIYSAGDLLNVPFSHWFDPVYYSFMTTSTIGYGDLYPVTAAGKALASLQSLFYLSYILLFIGFFRMGKEKGYFGDKKGG